jgi:tRNA1Val (adenine37-N6)-methyltransferase
MAVEELTLDTILNGCMRLFQKKRGYRFSLDAILLAHFISLKSRSKAIDLGTGSGVIPIIKAASFSHAHWTGLEIQEQMAIMAQKNIELNRLQDRIKIVNGDARRIKDILPAHSFDVVAFNPPYRRMNSGRINPDQEKAVARHEIKGSLKIFLQAARYLLKPAGKVFTVYPAQRLAELVSLFRENCLEPKRMRFVFSDIASEAEFVLVEGRAGSGAELKIEAPLLIYDENKKYTEQMTNIFTSLAATAAASGGG